MTFVLIGYRGCGKSTVGKRLANALWYKFADTDRMVGERAGKTIAEIFNDDGEAYFRELEAVVVAECCKQDDHVIALGGGAVLREDNRQAITGSGAKVVYLKCDPEVLLKRIQNDPETGQTRPPLTTLGGGIDEIQQLLTEREALYRQLAKLELDVTNLSAEEACKYIQRML